MKKSAVLILIFIVILALSVISHAQVNSETQDLFGNNSEAPVIVVLKDNSNILKSEAAKNIKSDNFEIKKSMIAQQKANVLQNSKLRKNLNIWIITGTGAVILISGIYLFRRNKNNK